MKTLLILKNCVGFDWDKGNINKNDNKHNVSWLECEQVFFNRPLLLIDDEATLRKKSAFMVWDKQLKGVGYLSLLLFETS